MNFKKHVSILWQEQTRLLVLSLVIVIGGLSLHIVAGQLAGGWPLLSAALPSVGTTVISVGLVALVVRSWIWNEAIEKTLARVKLDESVRGAGLTKIEFFPDVDWGTLFVDASNITIAAISARPLLSGTSSTHLKAAITRTGTKTTLVLADPFNKELMEHYDFRFGEVLGTRANKSKQALREFLTLVKEIPDIDDKIAFKLTGAPLGFSFYQFDELRIFAPYLNEQNQRDSARIPMFFYKGGSLATRMSDPDIQAVVKAATTSDRRTLESGLAG